MNLSEIVRTLRDEKARREKNNVISLQEFNDMLELAETNPGMLEMLEQAKVFYTLANPTKQNETM